MKLLGFDKSWAERVVKIAVSEKERRAIVEVAKDMIIMMLLTIIM